MDPTSDEIAAFTCIKDLFIWAGIQGDASTDHTAFKTLLDHLGCGDGSSHWRALAFIKEPDFEALVNTWRISVERGDARPPSALELGQAGLVGHAARVAAGLNKASTSAPIPSGAAPGPTPGAAADPPAGPDPGWTYGVCFAVQTGTSL